MVEGAARSERRFQHLHAVVRDAGIKLTPQRLEILRELARSESHPDAETVHREVKARMAGVSLDTVYRTLWMLRDLGVVKTLGPNGDVVRFDVNLERHHHYVCVRCGLVRDFDSADLDHVRLPPTVASFGTIMEAQVEVRGLCASCQAPPPRSGGSARGSEKTKTKTTAKSAVKR